MSTETWVLREDHLPSYEQNVGDILFTLGNGILGIAGTPTLAPHGAQGMFAGGMYAAGPAEMHWMPEPGHAARDNERFPTNDGIYPLRVKSLIACPRVFAVRLTWNGREVKGPGTFTRSLDLEHGTLTCKTTLTIPGGQLTIIDERFVSCDDLHLLAQRLEVTSTAPGTLDVALEIDATVKNSGKFDLWAKRSAAANRESLTWRGIACDTGSELSLCQHVRAEGTSVFDASDPLTSASIYSFSVAACRPVVVERFVGVGFSTYDADPRTAAQMAAEAAAKDGFDACAQRQRAHWRSFWDDSDIIIGGCDKDQLAVRYSLFELHSATPPPDGTISMGAKFLSGEWYRACVFWDDDVFIGPYFTRAQPAASRGHLLYRYRTLDEARKSAMKHGNTGARYPLESMPTNGEDAAMPWIIFGKTEIHTSCDVAWAIVDYFRWTGDAEFMRSCGAEMLDETARFWMSRFTETERGLEMHGVCGPDEYHPVVNNSVYTSALARENLRLAAEYGRASDDEKQTWLEAAEHIFCHQPNDRGVIEQCDGFFSLPDWHRGQHVAKAVEYQLLKQADIVMLRLLLPQLYSDEVVRANYEYYEPHTVHDSSLSTGAHAIVAAQLGMIDEAYDKFCLTAYTQLEDRLKNTHQGLHAACIGMVPRIIMEGFAGLRIENNAPKVSPHLPTNWDSVNLPFSYHGRRYRCSVRRQDGEMEATIALAGR